jgi:hypothetical protein
MLHPERLPWQVFSPPYWKKGFLTSKEKVDTNNLFSLGTGHDSILELAEEEDKLVTSLCM